MANNKKTTKAVETKTDAVKTVAAPQVVEKDVAVEKAAPAVKAEAPKETAVKAAAEKKAPAAKKATKASAKAAEKKAPAAKKTSKTAAKPAAEKKAPAKRGPKAKKPVTIDDICAKLAKKIDAAKAAKLANTIAVDVEVWGWEDGSNKHLYVEVKDGKADVQPYEYEACNFKAFISFADAVALVDGKLSLMDAFTSGKLNAIGIVGDAVKLASIF